MYPTAGIRSFNTKDTYPEQALDNDLSQAVVADNMVFLRGQVGQDLESFAFAVVADQVPAARSKQWRTIKRAAASPRSLSNAAPIPAATSAGDFTPSSVAMPAAGR